MKIKRENKQGNQFNRTVDSRPTPDIYQLQTRARVKATSLEAEATWVQLPGTFGQPLMVIGFMPPSMGHSKPPPPLKISENPATCVLPIETSQNRPIICSAG